MTFLYWFLEVIKNLSKMIKYLIFIVASANLCKLSYADYYCFIAFALQCNLYLSLHIFLCLLNSNYHTIVILAMYKLASFLALQFT